MIPSGTGTKTRASLEIDAAAGLVRGARFVASPNFDARPAGMQIDTLVIHSISLPPGKFGGPGIEQLFCNSLNSDEHTYYMGIKDLKVSAHLLIRRTGELIQFVPLHFRAWHAGLSCCDGRSGVNDFSIGIELEGTDHLPFENAQYESLVGITRVIQQVYPVTPERIYGHSDIAPGRKSDPGSLFDWKRYLDAG